MKRLSFLRNIIAGIAVVNVKPVTRHPTDMGEDELSYEYHQSLWPNDEPFPCQVVTGAFGECPIHEEGCGEYNYSCIGYCTHAFDCCTCRIDHNEGIKASDPEWYEDITIDTSSGHYKGDA